MPPKKPGDKPSKKNVEKAKQRVVEDKTFGMKNKKGAKAQKFIEQVHKSASARFEGSNSAADKRAAQKAAAAEKAMLNSLFKPVRSKTKPQQEEDENKKLQETEAGKKNIYVDIRNDEAFLCADGHSLEGTSEQWDQETLERVVKEKHEKQKTQPTTNKICKHFLDSVEKGLYGWFWICPNGGENCKYRHALPEGYVLKRDRKKAEEDGQTISMEDLIDKERASLGETVTPVTFESFMKWKKKKIAEKRKRLKEETSRKAKDIAAGKSYGVTGREFFSFRPELAGEDDAEAQDYTREETEETGEAEGTKQKGFDASIFNVDYGSDDEDATDTAVEAAPKRAKFTVDLDGVPVDAGLFSNLDDAVDQVDISKLPDDDNQPVSASAV